ncbi:MAG: helix-turn-helix domain-containing protein [Candidatus Binatia bacterium]
MVKQEVIEFVITGKLRYSQAARKLGVTPRTVQNYCRRYLERGLDGLKDQRKGNHRKLTLSEEAAIVAMKRERPQRSARLIRDRLRLKVSEEAVRLILAKHHLNGRALTADFATTTPSPYEPRSENLALTKPS